MKRLIGSLCVVVATLVAASAHAAETLCDSSVQNCRTPLLTLIQNETQGIDVGFWFMEDQRYVNAIIARWQAGVPVRLLVDPRANPTYPLNATSLSALQNAGIPMRKRTASGILHWKAMLFAGQNTVEFGSANYSDNAFVPVAPYSNYVSESILFTDDPALVNSFKTKFDDSWTDTTNYATYANITGALTRNYATFPISPDMNWPPNQDYGSRAVSRYNAETQKIDVIMYRVTDQRHTNAIIAAKGRGIPVRYLGETNEYRDPDRLWVAWNMDRIYAAGIPMRVRGNQGENHEKVVLLYGQAMTIFGSSNWTSPSATSQQEHNYFTTKAFIFQFFQDQFERKWNNSNPTGIVETVPFTPLPPDKAVNVSPANVATGVATAGVKLTWYGGPWAHVYDIYFGTNPNPPLLAANQNLGPSETTAQKQSFTLPTLAAGTTYYWKVVSKTMAGLSKTGDIWSFTTAGTPPPPPPPPPGAETIVLWSSHTPAANIHGNWAMISDAAASGGSALQNPDQGQSKISPALASPANYFERTFTVLHGTAYHVWVRLRAQGNNLSNDSVHVQFSGSVDSLGSPTWRIGTSSSAEIVLQAGPNDTADTGYGWSENGWGSLGPHIYFAADGTQTVRVQQREDGAIVDEIVLSPDTYLTTSPGARDNDTTILTENDGSSSPPPPPPPPPPSSTIVLWSSDVTSGINGNWQQLADGTAAGASALWNPDAAQAKISPALASPTNYWETTFTAAANTAYHVWVRLRAQSNSLGNDSISMQFNDSVNGSGTAMMRIGTTDSAAFVLQDGPTGANDSSWGWADNGWGALGVDVFFAAGGTHTLRVQQREDGAIIDQIVLSPDTYLSTPPGPRRNDTTILPKNSGS